MVAPFFCCDRLVMKVYSRVKHSASYDHTSDVRQLPLRVGRGSAYVRKSFGLSVRKDSHVHVSCRTQTSRPNTECLKLNLKNQRLRSHAVGSRT